MAEEKKVREQPQEPPKETGKKVDEGNKKITSSQWVIIVISIIFCWYFVSSCFPTNEVSKTTPTTTQTPTTKTPTEQAKEEVKTVNVGDDIQVGDVKWKVLEVSKEDTLGDQYYQKTAGGIFVVIKVRAELTGKSSGTVNSSQFSIIDNKGRSFSSSSEGSTAISMSGKEDLFFKQVNPNVPIEGYIVFDVAKDAEGLKLKIKDLVLTSDKSGMVNLGI